jgi:hypothetical protein
MKQLRAGLMGLLVLSAACGASRSEAAAVAPNRGTTATESASNAIQVQIDNQNFNDMSIYVVSGGQRWLLGQAGGLSKTTLTITPGLATGGGRVRLAADGIGGGRVTTPQLLVAPGQGIFWTIGSDPATSSATVG